MYYSAQTPLPNVPQWKMAIGIVYVVPVLVTKRGLTLRTCSRVLRFAPSLCPVAHRMGGGYLGGDGAAEADKGSPIKWLSNQKFIWLVMGLLFVSGTANFVLFKAL